MCRMLTASVSMKSPSLWTLPRMMSVDSEDCEASSTGAAATALFGEVSGDLVTGGESLLVDMLELLGSS